MQKYSFPIKIFCEARWWACIKWDFTPERVRLPVKGMERSFIHSFVLRFIITFVVVIIIVSIIIVCILIIIIIIHDHDRSSSALSPFKFLKPFPSSFSPNYKTSTIWFILPQINHCNYCVWNTFLWCSWNKWDKILQIISNDDI